MRCPYCRGTGSEAGVDGDHHWRNDLRFCPECAGKGWVATAHKWLRAWWRSPAETPLQKAINAVKVLFVVLAVGAGLRLVVDVGDAMQRLLTPAHIPNWLKRADPTDDDFARARAIVASAKAEVRALPRVQKDASDREDATLVLALTEGLSDVYPTARRNRAISPDALNRAEDIDDLAFRAARREQCDADECNEVFSASDYENALISYTAGALAAQREPPQQDPPKGPLLFLRNLF